MERNESEGRPGRDRAVQDLIDKQAIAEVVHRYCRAVDRGDLELLRTVYHPDARDERSGAITLGEDIASAILDPVMSGMLSTNHHVGTQTIVVEGDSAAAETYSAGNHILKDGRRLRSLVRYIDRFERREDEWRIVRRQMILENSEVAPALDAVEGAPPTAARRDRGDPSYANFVVGTAASIDGK
jgi:ketosteroid isomerase-like protein